MIPTLRRLGRTLSFLLLAGVGFAQQTTQAEAPLTNSQLADKTQADAYYQSSNLMAALPYYERLARDVPTSALFAERFAVCLMAKADNLPPGDEKQASWERFKAEAKRAHDLGDNSPLMQMMIDHINKGGAPVSGLSPKMQAAEKAFSEGRLDDAIENYKGVAADEPRNYEARLYVGDMYFRKHDPKQAGEWFQKAVDVDPNRETAYRYWGDALAADGEPEGAKEKYMQAIIAEPYSSRAWAGIQQWARANHAILTKPNVPLPKAPEPQKTADGKQTTTITVDPVSLKNPDGGGFAWMMYSMNRGLWRGEKFAKTYPNAKEYRHTLAEEAESLNLVATVVREKKIPEKKMDASLHDLMALANDNMIEPFVLLQLADNGIAQDYPAYRETHRAELKKYIEQYILHPAESGK